MKLFRSLNWKKNFVKIVDMIGKEKDPNYRHPVIMDPVTRKKYYICPVRKSLGDGRFAWLDKNGKVIEVSEAIDKSLLKYWSYLGGDFVEGTLTVER